MISRPISGVMENLNNFDSELCNSINICLYITSLLYCDIIHKPIVYMYYTWDKLFEAPGFKSTLQQNKLVLIWKYVYFIDIIELGDTYSWSTKINLFILISLNAGSHFSLLKVKFLLMKHCSFGRVDLLGSSTSEQSKHILIWKPLCWLSHHWNKYGTL